MLSFKRMIKEKILPFIKNVVGLNKPYSLINLIINEINKRYKFLFIKSILKLIMKTNFKLLNNLKFSNIIQKNNKEKCLYNQDMFIKNSNKIIEN
jgi:hypothetical protein